jgi:hypothetical protein
MYDATIGRFLSVDQLVSDPSDLQAYNRYSYVRNDPLARTDPSGWSDLKASKTWDPRSICRPKCDGVIVPSRLASPSATPQSTVKTTPEKTSPDNQSQGATAAKGTEGQKPSFWAGFWENTKLGLNGLVDWWMDRDNRTLKGTVEERAVATAVNGLSIAGGMAAGRSNLAAQPPSYPPMTERRRSAFSSLMRGKLFSSSPAEEMLPLATTRRLAMLRERRRSGFARIIQLVGCFTTTIRTGHAATATLKCPRFFQKVRGFR